MKNLFNNLNITWKKLIIFSIFIGIYTGLVMCIPIFKDTSIQDIGISYEWWVLFAVIIVVNSSKWYDAMIKCFIFFLISQPLVYLVEVLFGKITFDMGVYYYTKIWLPITFLTLPGGVIAYFSKKQNIWGSIILGIGNTIQLILGIFYFSNAFNKFPNHLLSAIFCIWSIIFMTFGIQKKNLFRIVSLIIPIIISIGVIIYCKINGLTLI